MGKIPVFMHKQELFPDTRLAALVVGSHAKFICQCFRCFQQPDKDLAL